MTNDRKQGVLVFNIQHPYRVSVDGAFEERHGIICHEFNNKASSNTAYDIEQMLLAAFSSIQRTAEKQTKKQIQKEEKIENDFYENNSPSDKDVKERADQLKLMFKMQREVRVSELTALFEELIAEKLISTDGDKVMYGNVWDTVHPADKLDILFRYVVFFVNPLQSLSTLDIAGEETNTIAKETNS